MILSLENHEIFRFADFLALLFSLSLSIMACVENCFYWSFLFSSMCFYFDQISFLGISFFFIDLTLPTKLYYVVTSLFNLSTIPDFLASLNTAVADELFVVVLLPS